MRSRVRNFWQHVSAARKYRTAVSLHGHTLYSREPLTILPRLLRAITFQGWNRYSALRRDHEVDVSRLWWTPPLSPRQAWLVETSQIENQLGCRPLVSLTDHDCIEAPLLLRVLDESSAVPISVEWTVPFHETFFHLGVHNISRRRARGVMRELSSYTAGADVARLTEILVALNEDPSVLIVVNHPLWDEKGIGRHNHRRAVEALIRTHRPLIHALELNGFRPARENLAVEHLAAAVGLPVLSGGDRHGREPNSNLNLTNAGCFAEFVDQIRRDGLSEVLRMPQQREGIALRTFRTASDIVRDDPDHGMGWTRWHDRVFYRCADGAARSLSAIWGEGPAPELVTRLVGSIQTLDRVLANPRVLAALRWASAEED